MTEETASAFLETSYRDLAAIVSAVRTDDCDAVAHAAQSLASSSARIHAEPLARAARALTSLARDPALSLETALDSLARAFADVECEIRGALDAEVPLFI